MSKVYDDELKGAFFTESKSQVLWRGNLTVEGTKGYYVIVESSNRDGKIKHELMKSVGLVHMTDEGQKTNQNSPDIGGRVQIDNKSYKFGSWHQRTDSGLEYLSASLRALSEEKDAPF